MKSSVFESKSSGTTNFAGGLSSGGAFIGGAFPMGVTSFARTGLGPKVVGFGMPKIGVGVNRH
jgi:hypothetical protein